MEETSDKIGVQQLVAAFIAHGIKRIVFSPGSRNAPLVVAFANDLRFETVVIPDERSAAFYALGMAEESSRPVAVMCTSGSALLNYYPAISEAFYRNIPVVVVSADRPSEWVDQGDGQTIRQENVFKNHICASTTVYENPQSEDQKWFNSRTIDEVLNTAKSNTGGPIHINFPFNEPLYDRTDQPPEKKDDFIQQFELEPRLSSKQLTQLKNTWNTASKKLILCGQIPNNSYLNEQLKQLATDKSVAIVVENTSNLQDRSFIHCIDRTISSFINDERSLFQPDLLITLGAAVISKKIKNYLRSCQPKEHWKIGASFPFMDTYQSLSTTIPMNENSFIDVLLDDGVEFKRNISRYGEQWKQLDYLVQEKHHNFIEAAPFCDLTVFDLILDTIPEKSNLHLANSSVIRYAQLFDPIESISYYCNRGTSGIDGSVSSAIGHAIAGEDKLHTLIVGDMSFFYDSNAFWNHHVPSNVRIFLINNGGGGIFDIIPGPQKTPKGDEFFVAQHSFTASSICDAFTINYKSANSLGDIEEQLQSFFEVQDNERPVLMEIFTDGKVSGATLNKYLEAVKVDDIPTLKSE